MSLAQGGEPEVRNAQNIIPVEKDIFGLEVPVRDTFSIHVIDGVNEHLEQGPTDIWLEPAFLGDVLEEITPFGEFEHDDGLGLFGVAAHFDLPVDLVLHHVD